MNIRLAFALCALLACYAFSVNASFIETVYSGTMSSQQLVPPKTNTEGGSFVCAYDRNSNPKTLDCDVQHTLSNAISATINKGAPQTGGPIIYSFPLQPSATINKHFRHIFNLADQPGLTVAQQELDFLNGQWYIQIASSIDPTGSIRGQVEHQDRFYARLSSENTIPITSGSTATGVALATYSEFSPKRRVSFDILHDVQAATGAEVRKGAIGRIGPVVHRFNSATSPVLEDVRYTIGEDVDIFNEEHYINIVSAKNPNGETRGQLIAIDPYPRVALTARLEGKQQVPSINTQARGCAIFTFDCDTGKMEYLVFHDVSQPVSAAIHAGNPGKTGNEFFKLSRSQNPIFGSRILRRDEEFLFYSQQFYVNIVSITHPTGELRGQITAQFDFFAYLSGTYVVPPVTTAAVGCATFRLKSNRRVLSYSIHHSVGSPTAVEIAIGQLGQNGQVDKPLRRAVNPIIGDDELMDDDELEYFIKEQMYVQVKSPSHPGGEIRGQIRRISPCEATRDSTLTIDSPFSRSSPNPSPGNAAPSPNGPPPPPPPSPLTTFVQNPSPAPTQPSFLRTFVLTPSPGRNPSPNPNPSPNNPSPNPSPGNPSPGLSTFVASSPNPSPNNNSPSPNPSPNNNSPSPNPSPNNSPSPNPSPNPSPSPSPNSVNAPPPPSPSDTTFSFAFKNVPSPLRKLGSSPAPSSSATALFSSLFVTAIATLLCLFM